MGEVIDKSKVSGIYLDVLFMITDAMNLTINFYESVDGSFGNYFDDGTATGISLNYETGNKNLILVF